jgi:hypothetical protein
MVPKNPFMIRFELKLLPTEGAKGADAKAIEDANQLAEHSYKHLKKLIGNKRCHRHPSSPNKLRVFAEKGSKYPRVEVVSYCCENFVKSLK